MFLFHDERVLRPSIGHRLPAATGKEIAIIVEEEHPTNLLHGCLSPLITISILLGPCHRWRHRGGPGLVSRDVPVVHIERDRHACLKVTYGVILVHHKVILQYLLTQSPQATHRQHVDKAIPLCLRMLTEVHICEVCLCCTVSNPEEGRCQFIVAHHTKSRRLGPLPVALQTTQH